MAMGEAQGLFAPPSSSEPSASAIPAVAASYDYAASAVMVMAHHAAYRPAAHIKDHE